MGGRELSRNLSLIFFFFRTIIGDKIKLLVIRWVSEARRELAACGAL